MFFAYQIRGVTNSEMDFSDTVTEGSRPIQPLENSVRFNELSIEGQIAEATVIALIDYERAEDGRMMAIIREFLKLKSGTKIGFEIGEEYPEASHYPRSYLRMGDGLVILFTGSSMRHYAHLVETTRGRRTGESSNSQRTPHKLYLPKPDQKRIRDDARGRKDDNNRTGNLRL